MPVGKDFIEYINGLGSTQPAPVADEGILTRALGYGLTAPYTAANNFSQSVEGLISGSPQSGGFLRAPVEEAPSSGFLNKTVDFVGGGLLPMAMELGATGGLARGIAGAAGVTNALGRTAISEGLGFGLLGAQQDRTTALEQTGEGVAYAGLSALPRKARLLPAALLGLGSKAFFDRNGGEKLVGDFTQGDAAGGIGFLAAMAMKQHVPQNVTPPPAGPRPMLGWRGGSDVIDTHPVNVEPGTATNGVVYGKASSTPQDFGPVIDATYTGQINTQPLLDIGQASDKFVQLTDFNAPQTEQQIVNRVPFRKDTIPMRGPSADYIAPESLVQKMWHPEIGRALEELGVKPTDPGVDSALQRLQMAMLEHEYLGDKRGQQVAFAKFFQELFDRPNYRSTLQTEDQFSEMIREGTRTPGNPSGTIYSPSTPLQSGLGEATTTGVVRGKPLPGSEVVESEMVAQARKLREQGNEEAARAVESEAARRGKISNLPEWMRTQGGFATPELTAAMARGAVGFGAGTAIGSASDMEDPWMLGAAFGLGAAVGPEVIARLRSKPTAPSPAPAPKFASTATPDKARPNLMAWIEQKKGEQQAKLLGITEQQKEVAARGKMQQLPEWQRTQGGSALNEAIMATGGVMSRAAIGGAVGGAAAQLDGNPDTDPLNYALGGAALLAGAPYGRRLIEALQNARRTSPFRLGNEMAGVANPFPYGLPMELKSSSRNWINPEGTKGKLYVEISDAAGQQQGYIKARVTGDKYLRVELTDLHADLQGKGLGLHMYDKLADEAAARGLTLSSDNSVSAKAAAVYSRMAAEGYQVTRNPHAVKFYPEQYLRGTARSGDYAADHFHWITEDGSPVFVVKPPLATVAKEAPNSVAQLAADVGSSPQGMKRFGREGGFAMPELAGAMARGGIGGFVGGSIGAQFDDPNDHQGWITGAFLGAGAGIFGPALSRAFAKALAMKKIQTAAPSQGKSWGTVFRNLGTALDEMSGAALRGSEKSSDRFVRWLDSNLGLTVPESVKRALLESKGEASLLLDQIDKSLLKISMKFKPDAVVKDLANKYLDGAIDSKAFLAGMAPHITANADVRDYATFITTARESINGLQRMIADGIGDPKMKKIVNDSIGQYLTRSYRIFTDPKYMPSENSIQAVMKELQQKSSAFAKLAEGDARVAMEQYIRDAKSGKSVFHQSGSPIGQAINQSVLKERKALSKEWREFLGEVDDPTERIYQTVFRVRPMSEASRYFDKLAGVSDNGMPHVFDSYADRDAFLNNTLQRLQNIDPQNTKLQQWVSEYSSKPMERMRLRQELPGLLAPSEEASTVAKHLTSLDAFQAVEKHPKFGVLQHKLVSRNVWDSLKTYDSMTDIIDHPFLRGVSNMHTFIKLNRTVFNPITVVRNFATVPAFMAIAKVTPREMLEAHEIMRNPKSPIYQEIMRQGISNVDQVKTEFYKEFQNITGSKYNFGNLDLTTIGLGKIDLDFAEAVGRRRIRNVMDFYRYPDNLVRMGAYIGAKRRIAQELGLAFDHPTVIQKATDFTNRYTMNYDAIAPLFKQARQVPFFNLFLSYTVEMGRIGKNLMEDLAFGNKGDVARHDRLYAMVPLAALAVAPELMNASAEDQLNEKDRKDWEKTKSLMPDYARNQYRWNLRRDPKTGQFSYWNMTPLIASDSYNQMVKGVANGDWESVAAVNPFVSFTSTPLFNIARSIASGEDYQTKREFRDAGDAIATVAKEILPPWAPGVGAEAIRFEQAYAKNAEGELGVTNQKTGNRLTPMDVWMPYFSGIKPSGTNLSALERRLMQETKRDIANEIAYLNDILRSDRSEDIKRAAYEKTKVVLANMQAEYRRRMAGPEARNQ